MIISYATDPESTLCASLSLDPIGLIIKGHCIVHSFGLVSMSVLWMLADAETSALTSLSDERGRVQYDGVRGFLPDMDTYSLTGKSGQ